MLETAKSNKLTFSIKAHQSLTHKINLADWEADAKTYLSALEPLQRDKRLDAVLFQFPFSFHYEPENRRYLDKLLLFFKEVPTAVEFRGDDWYNSRVINALKDRGVALASLDMPALKGLPPPTDTVTAPFAYIRLHGRNQASWWGSDSAARYDYFYPDKELEAWANRIKQMMMQAEKVLIYFNNHPEGQAVKNAQTLMGMLERWCTSIKLKITGNLIGILYIPPNFLLSYLLKEQIMREYSGVREVRPDTPTYTDWGGGSCEAAEQYGKKCLARADRTFSQGLQCQQINSVMALLSMEDSAFVVHSPLGCSGCCSMANDWFRVGQAHRRSFPIRNARIIVTNLDEKDVIHGGEQKLREALRLAWTRYQPKLIFIFTSCASGIIGDDVDFIAADVQKEFADPIVIPVHCEGFKSKICASGYDASFLAMTKYIFKDIPKGKQEIIPGLLNLFAPPTVSFQDQTEIERILGAIGITTNYIPFYSSLEKIRRIPQAQASTAICKVFADEFMKDLQQDYGIPYSHTIMPIGTRNTDKWLLGIAEIMGKTSEAKAYIEKERERVMPLVEDLRRRLEGKRVVICGGTGRSFAAAALIDDFGMKLAGMTTPVYDDDAQRDVEYLNNIHGNFTIDVANMMPFEQVNMLHKLKPDLFIGVPIWAARLGIPTTHVLDIKRPTMGYNNLVYLGNKIAYALENPGYNKKIAKYSHLPYKQSWYDDDTFKFVKEF
ncbi:hypothetical protein FACS1894130_10710 [Spirochaetia bacterium]|nr:hypothetical protein FACS1894130_10710 [Spirochaetia bacterium]